MRTLRTTALNSAGIAKKRLQSRYKVADTAQRRKSRMSDERELFDGRVLIYRTTNSGDVYQARIYVASEQRYVSTSLKTRELVPMGEERRSNRTKLRMRFRKNKD